MRKRLALLVASLAALALGAGNAVAYENVNVGDTVTGSITNFTLGSFVTCTSGSWSGPIAIDNGPDSGGAGSFTSGVFGNCKDSFGGTATVSFTNTWSFAMDGAGNVSISQVTLDVKLSTGTTCTYTGAFSGAYDAADWGGTGAMVLSGSLTRVSGSFPCTATAAVGGTVDVVGPNGIIDL